MELNEFQRKTALTLHSLLTIKRNVSRGFLAIFLPLRVNRDTYTQINTPTTKTTRKNYDEIVYLTLWHFFFPSSQRRSLSINITVPIPPNSCRTFLFSRRPTRASYVRVVVERSLRIWMPTFAFFFCRFPECSMISRWAQNICQYSFKKYVPGFSGRMSTNEPENPLGLREEWKKKCMHDAWEVNCEDQFIRGDNVYQWVEMAVNVSHGHNSQMMHFRPGPWRERGVPQRF